MGSQLGVNQYIDISIRTGIKLSDDMRYKGGSIFRYKVRPEVLNITSGSASTFKENVFQESNI